MAIFVFIINLVIFFLCFFGVLAAIRKAARARRQQAEARRNGSFSQEAYDRAGPNVTAVSSASRKKPRKKQGSVEMDGLEEDVDVNSMLHDTCHSAVQLEYESRGLFGDLRDN